MDNSFDDINFIDSVPIYPDYINPSLQILLPNDNKQEKEDNNNKFTPIGKKRKREIKTGDHNKYSDDNLRRKIKSLILRKTRIFINEKLKIFFKDDINKIKMELLIINQKQIVDASTQFNKEFLSKNLGDIFSDNISERYRSFPLGHNRIIINYLKNEKDENKRQYFNKLFNITFLDCLEHFRGTKQIEELEGLSGLDDIKKEKEYENDKNYLKQLIYYIMNFEKITNNKRKRNRKKKKNIEEK